MSLNDALAFLNASKAARDQEIADREAAREREAAERELSRRRTFRQRLLFGFTLFAVIAGFLGYAAWNAQQASRNAQQYSRIIEDQAKDYHTRAVASIKQQEASNESLRRQRAALLEEIKKEQRSTRVANDARKKSAAAAKVALRQTQIAQVQARRALENERRAQSAQQIAFREKAEADRGRALAFAASGEAALKSGDDDDAAVLLAAAFSLDPTKPDILPEVNQALQRLPLRIQAHDGPVHFVAFSDAPGRTLIATAGATNARLWDAAGKPLHVFADRKATEVTAMAFDPAGRYLATGSNDGSVLMHRVDGMTLGSNASDIAVTDHAGRVNTVAFSRDGGTVASAGGNDLVVTSIAGQPKRICAVPNQSVTAAGFTDGDRTIVAALGDGRLALVDAKTCALDIKPLAATGAATLAFVRDAALVAIGSGTKLLLYDGTARTVSTIADIGSPIESLAVDRAGARMLVLDRSGRAHLVDRSGKAIVVGSGKTVIASMSPADDSLALVGSDGSITFAAASGATLGDLRISRAAPPTSAAYSRDGAIFATGDDRGNLLVWRPPQGARTSAATGKPVDGLQIDRHGTRALTFASDEGAVRVWATGGTPSIARVLTAAPNGAFVASARFSPDDRRIITAAPNAVVVWNNTASPNAIAPLMTMPNRVKATRFSDALIMPDGRGILSALTGEYGTTPAFGVQRWNLTSIDGRALIAQENEAQNGISDVQIDDGGHEVLAFSRFDGTTSLSFINDRFDYEPASALDTATVDPAYHPAAALAHRSSIAAVGNDKGDIVLCASNGEEYLRFKAAHAAAVTALAFSDDDRWLVSGAADGTVHVWDIDGRRQLTVLTNPSTAPIASVAFSPGSAEFVLAVARDGAGPALLWGRDSSHLFAALPFPGARVTRAAISADGTTIITGTRDGRVSLWDVTSAMRTPVATPSRMLVAQAVRERTDAVRCSASRSPLVTQAQAELLHMGALSCGAAPRHPPAGTAARTTSDDLARTVLDRTGIRTERTNDLTPLIALARGNVLGLAHELSPMMTGTTDLGTENGLDALAADDAADAARTLLPAYLAAGAHGPLQLPVSDLVARYDHLTTTLLDPFGAANHSERIDQVAFADSGARLVVAYSSGEAVVWETPSGRVRYRFPEHAATPAILTTQRHGSLAFVFHFGDQRLTAWNTVDGTIAYRVKIGRTISRVSLSADGSLGIAESFVTTAKRFRVFLDAWRTSDGKRLPQVELTSFSNSPRVGAGFAAVNAGNRLHVIELATGKVATLDADGIAPGDSVTGFRFNDRGDRVAALIGNVARVWDVHHPAAPRATLAYPNGDAAWLTFAHDGRTLAIAGSNGILLWNLERPRVYRVFETPGFAPSTVGVFSEDNRHLFLANGRGAASVWNIDDGTSGGEITSDEARGLLIDVAANATIAASAGANGSVYLWHFDHVAAEPRMVHESAALNALRLRADGKRILTLSGGELRLWDVSGAAKARWHQRLATSRADAAAFAGDRISAVRLGATCRGTIAANAASPSFVALTTLDDRGAMVGCMPISAEWRRSPSGRFVAWLDRGRVSIADVRSGTRQAWPAGLPSFRDLRFGSSDDLLMLDDQRGLTLADRAGHLLVASGTVPTDANVTRSPDGRRLVVYGNGLGIWDISHPGHPLPLQTIETGASRITHAEFHPIDGTLLTIDGEGRVRRWSADGAPRTSYTRDDTPIGYATFTSDGRTIVAVRKNGAVELLDSTGLGLFTLPVYSAPVAEGDGIAPQLAPGATLAIADGSNVFLFRIPPVTIDDVRSLARRLHIPLGDARAFVSAAVR